MNLMYNHIISLVEIIFNKSDNNKTVIDKSIKLSTSGLYAFPLSP